MDKDLALVLPRAPALSFRGLVTPSSLPSTEELNAAHEPRPWSTLMVLAIPAMCLATPRSL